MALFFLYATLCVSCGGGDERPENVLQKNNGGADSRNLSGGAAAGNKDPKAVRRELRLAPKKGNCEAVKRYLLVNEIDKLERMTGGNDASRVQDDGEDDGRAGIESVLDAKVRPPDERERKIQALRLELNGLEGINPRVLPDITIENQNGFNNENAGAFSLFMDKNSDEPYMGFYGNAAEGIPLLVISSGYLDGLEAPYQADATSEFLKEYLESGGAVVVFGQGKGKSFSILPVPTEADGTHRDVGGYGWTDDQSSEGASVYMDTWHDIFSGQTKDVISGLVDGYFTSYPANTKILLRRISNSRPAMITYYYGKGLVMATTLTPDFTYRKKTATEDELTLLRDIIAWGKNKGLYAKARPGGNVKLNVGIENCSLKDVAGVRFSLLDPSGKIVKKKTISVLLPVGSGASLPFTYEVAPDGPPGIWRVDYVITDSEGNEIQPDAETKGGSFSVFKSRPDPKRFERPLDFSVNSEIEKLNNGQDAIFMVTIWNNTVTVKKVRFYYDWNKGTSTYLDEVTIPPGKSVVKDYTVKAVLSDGKVSGVYVHFFDEAEPYKELHHTVKVEGETWGYVGTALKGFENSKKRNK